MLPGRSGLELCSDLQQQPTSPSPPIILLTALSEEENIIRGLEAGACDYITKPFSSGILLARVKNALRQTNRPSSASNNTQQIRVGALRIDLNQHKVTLENQPLSLTLTEFKILHLLAGQPGRVFTRYQIVDQVHGEDYAVTDRSIDVQIVNLRKKMAAYETYIETVRGIGYRFTAE
jgi:two-component system phosphate regulon response regulator PhoB